jgi:hypothetical protein
VTRARAVIHWLAAPALALLFGCAAISKIQSSATSSIYSDAISRWPFLRFALISVEILVAVALLLSCVRPAAALVALILLSGFTGVLMLELTREHVRPCGCFGNSTAVADDPATRTTLKHGIARNAAAMGAAVLLLTMTDYAGGMNRTLKARYGQKTQSVYAD